jgi:caffeoyl-CoA O-methyltransferase
VTEEQAPLLAFLVRLIGARQVVEVGTFTGLSGLSLATALPADGRLITCDVSEEWTEVAREAWARAGVAERVDLRIAPAIRTLGGLPDGLWIDLAFIDADKGFYIDYWEELVPRVRPGGLLVADNTLYHGAVIDPDAPGGVAAIRAFNDHVRADERVDDVLLTVADGLTLARKR